MKTYSDIEVVALTIYAEARGEDWFGMEMVATVIYNRAGGKAEKMAAVCKAPKQFSCWNGEGPISFVPIKDVQAWVEACELAGKLFSGTFTAIPLFVDDTIIAADHFYNPSVCSPSWAEGKICATVGNHRFLQLGYSLPEEQPKE
jgi:spore germination cell wall hydrolase CwlJ-like protein